MAPFSPSPTRYSALERHNSYGDEDDDEESCHYLGNESVPGRLRTRYSANLLDIDTRPESLFTWDDRRTDEDVSQKDAESPEEKEGEGGGHLRHRERSEGSRAAARGDGRFFHLGNSSRAQSQPPMLRNPGHSHHEPVLSQSLGSEHIPDPYLDDLYRTDSEASTDSDDNDMSPLPAANIHSSKNPQYRSSEPSPRFRSISWNPFTLSRKTKFPHLLNDQPSSRSYGAIPPADFIARPTSPTRQSHERPHWRKSFIFSKRKSGDYDEEGSADDYVAGSGMRVWYEDYTTIDWIHDTVKERIRLRSLRSIPGVKGWWINHICHRAY
ncbi:hypothetical protein DFS34DRAFT_659477 [Phlyctochytrium arcticum]|nr:hypothetical protein DFS34DRAFT_659477 [Phlyctochytrium arcticum]